MKSVRTKKGIGRKDINYGAGIVIEAVAATDVTQTKVSMQLNDDDFSCDMFLTFFGRVVKSQKVGKGDKGKSLANPATDFSGCISHNFLGCQKLESWKE